MVTDGDSWLVRFYSSPPEREQYIMVLYPIGFRFFATSKTFCVVYGIFLLEFVLDHLRTRRFHGPETFVMAPLVCRQTNAIYRAIISPSNTPNKIRSRIRLIRLVLPYSNP